MKKKYEGITKFVACGDLHARNNKPQYRKDDYWGAFRKKLTWIVDFANKQNARLLIAGDLFDSSRVPMHVTNIVTGILQTAKFTPYVVPGQHDLLYHTDIEDTPLFNLHINNVVEILSGVYDGFTGVGFGQEIPPDANQFLIIHKSVTPAEPPFFLDDAIAAQSMMKEFPQFKYTISGDYHPWHYAEREGRHLINVGALMRNQKTMHKHKPVVWLIDTEADKVEMKEVPHELFEDVFDTEAIAYNEEHGIKIDTSKLQELILEGGEELELDAVVWQVYKETESTIDKTTIREVLEGCKL